MYGAFKCYVIHQPESGDTRPEKQKTVERIVPGEPVNPAIDTRAHQPTKPPSKPREARRGVSPTQSPLPGSSPAPIRKPQGNQTRRLPPPRVIATTLQDDSRIISRLHAVSGHRRSSPAILSWRAARRASFLDVEGAAAASRGGPGDQRPRELAGGRAAGRLLPADVPDRGGRRPRGDEAHPAGRFDTHAVPAPDALPRLLRSGLRRIDHAQVEEGEGGEGRAPQPQHARVRRHREDQGPTRDRLPAHRLLRRHHRHRRERRRLLGEQSIQTQCHETLFESSFLSRRFLRFALLVSLVSCVQSEGPWYDVETGRRDGNVTVAEYAENDLAPPDSNIVDVKTFFSVKSLNSKDIAVLFGCHSIGTSHCEPIQQRLYNFTGKMDQDPSLDPAYAAQLKKLCPPPGPGDRGQGKTKVPMDPGSGNTFDLSYYRHVLATGGLFQSDSSLLDDPVTRGYVKKVANATSPDEYYVDFAAAMVKMGRTDVLYGDLGEIRPTCGAFVD